MRKIDICTGGTRGLCMRGIGRQDRQLNTYDWLADVPGNAESTDLVEVQFKNTRKAYYHNVNNLDLRKGDIVAVEASPGHDIGVVTLTGRLVKLQIKKANLKSADDIKRIYRIAKPVDMDKYREAKSREHDTMIQSRQIAKSLGLEMKIGDVEYQGDGNKAIFYYIADERVDFRQLIKVLAETFHVRIEMKQIGARQEAGRNGGTGPCGRELCCATWMKNFSSVSTNAARFQDISLNPQKLAGMCAKLKCCLNYEVDQYMEAGAKMPPKDAVLQTKDSDYHLFKTDILAGLCTYSTDKNLAANVETITVERARAIIEMNKKGQKPLSLMDDGKAKPEKPSLDLLADADVSRFDKTKKKRKNKNKNKQQGGKGPVANGAQAAADNGQQPRKARDERPNAQPQKGGDHPQKTANGQGRPNGTQPRNNRQPNRGPRPQRNRGAQTVPGQHGGQQTLSQNGAQQPLQAQSQGPKPAAQTTKPAGQQPSSSPSQPTPPVAQQPREATPKPGDATHQQSQE
jgi:cell fate regulator YaaT (PSP1 superfamily)